MVADLAEMFPPMIYTLSYRWTFVLAGQSRGSFKGCASLSINFLICLTKAPAAFPLSKYTAQSATKFYLNWERVCVIIDLKV